MTVGSQLYRTLLTDSLKLIQSKNFTRHDVVPERQTLTYCACSTVVKNIISKLQRDREIWVHIFVTDNNFIYRVFPKYLIYLNFVLKVNKFRFIEKHWKKILC